MNALAAWFENSAIGRWYGGRERNEQIIILALAVLIAVSLGWLLAWKPVSDWHGASLNRLANAQATVDYVKANQNAARSARSSGGAERGSLIQVLSRAASAHQLKLNRVQPEESGLLNVVLQGQPFDNVFEWMAQLERNNGVSVEQATFKAEERTGYVNAQIRFR